MKRVFLNIIVVVIFLTFITLLSSADSGIVASPNNNGRHVDAGYIARDSFPYYQSGNWVFGGSWLAANKTVAVVSDTSTDDETYMTRKFIMQTDSAFTTEFRIISIMGSDGAYFKLRDSVSNKDAIVISVEKVGSNYDQCYYTDVSGNRTFLGSMPNTSLDVAQKNDSTGFKIVANTATKKVDIYFNGTEIVNGADFTDTTVTGIDTIDFGVTAAGKGVFMPGTLNIYTGYGVYEDFVTANAKEFSNPSWDICENLPEWVFNAGYTIPGTTTIPSSNEDDKWKGNDGNINTYWEGNIPDPNDPATLPYSLPFDKSTFVVDLQGQLCKVNKIVVTEPDPRAQTYQLCYCVADGTQWGTWRYIGYTGVYPNGTFNVNAPSNTFINADDLPLSTPTHRVVITLPDTVSCQQISINFGEPKSPDMKPAVSEIEAYYDASADKTVPADLMDDSSNVPSDWTTNTAGGSAQVVQTSRYQKEQDFNVLKLTDTSSTDAVSISKQFSLLSGNKGSTVDFDMMMPSNSSNGLAAIVSQANGNELKLYTDSDSVYLTGTGIDTPIEIVKGYTENVWMHFQLKYNKDTGKLQVSHDGSSPAAAKDLSLDASFASEDFNLISLTTDAAGQGTVYFDCIRILPIVNTNTIPAPVPVSTGKTIVQAQTCTMWRDGSTAGWKDIDAKDPTTGDFLYLDRKPILGWYDESDPEVTDWQIKWAVEHGISSFMYCWYRYDTGPIPVKESYCTDALYLGQFNATFRDYMKFTTMWENDTGFGMYSADDLMNNLLPYWINVLFKNPNYLKTSDNKPILYILDAATLLKQVGDYDKDGVPDEYSDVKKLLDDMRQRCIDAGFGGLIIATENRDASSSTLNMISQCGFDDVFPYCYSVTKPNPTDSQMISSIQSTLNAQVSAIKNSTSTNKPGVIPTVSMGWDYRPWAVRYGVAPSDYDRVFSYTYKFGYDAYNTLAQWVKNTFFNTTGVASFGNASTGVQNMVMLDNWNEFGEGHYILPTLGNPTAPGGAPGFGYLDAIRSTFGTNADSVPHDDINPLANGYGPYDKWYPAGWNDDVNVKVKGVTLPNSTITLSATGTDTTYIQPKISPLNANDTSVTYTSTSPSIASVDKNGKVTGLKDGTTQINVTTNDGNFKATCTVTVKLPQITSSTYTVNQTSSIISGIAPYTTISVLENKLDNSASQIKVYNEQGTEITDSSTKLSTGMNVKLVIGNITYQTTSVAVLGDVNGDGQVNVSDIVKLTAHILNKSTLQNQFFTAGDINGDGVINVTDIIKSTLYILNGSFTYN